MLTGKKFNRFNTFIFIVLAIISISLISAIVFSPYIPKSIEYAIGDIADQQISSPQHLEFESQVDIEINRKKFDLIKEKTGPVYQIDKSVNSTIRQNIRLLFEQIRQKDLTLFTETFLSGLDDNILAYLNELSEENINEIEKLTFELSDSILADGIKQKNKEFILSYVENSVEKNAYDSFIISFISYTLTYYLKDNLVYDPIKTQIVYDKMIESVPLSKSIFKQGQPIIYSGETVTAFHIEAFKALGIYQQKINFFKLFFIILISLFTFILVERFIYLFYPMFYNNKFCLLLSIITIIILLFSRLSLFMNFLPAHALTYLTIPIGIASILVTFLLRANIAFVVGTMVSILVAIMYKLDFSVFLFLLFCSYTTTISIYNASKRSDLIIAGYFVGLLNCFFILSLGLFQETTQLMFYATNIILGFVNGVLSAMISLAILPYFESLFKITTNQTLLELSNLNHPLMKKLLFNAPGTYQHSLMVANLAEAAADEVGANSVLCRVGSYFHDIGKLKRPEFFIENQFSKDNPHESLTPRMSKTIIISHTEEGLIYAKKHQLPSLIQQIITEHHGTSLLSIFYLKELKGNKSNKEKEDEFRYPGPKPSSKESGIIMLADSVEAATKAIEKPTAVLIENTIEKIVKEKIDDLQLVDCPLSFSEITQIKNTFINIYKGVHHKRNDYEKDKKNLTKRK